MYAFLFLLLVTTIAAVPLDANEWSDRVLSPNDVAGPLPPLLPESISSDFALQLTKSLKAILPCLTSEGQQHTNATEEEIMHIVVVCYLKTGLKDSALLQNVALFRQVHGGLKPTSDECAAAIIGLKWTEDPRLNASSVPLSKEDRRNVCKFLGDYHTEYCKVEEACADSRDRQVEILLSYYSFLHMVATDGTPTDQNCPTASIPFVQKINPHAFTADFDAHQESLLIPSPCSEWPVPLL
ncbi:hypothetical protein M3Y99_00952600 [Aphelenchoides fujianensis]|nr:hypothetical protein M3Y99_00952600 [Aphelenchoides fujianensis]